MNGFKIFQFHIALKIHFTKTDFSIFQNKGFLRGSYETYLGRKDYLLYEKLSTKFNNPIELVQFLASNIMYNNFNVVYDLEESEGNYQEYLRRKQSITKIFTDDMYTLLNKGVNLSDSLKILNMFLGKKITIESFSILNDLTGNTISNLKEDSNNLLLFNDDIIRVQKSKGFVLYKKEKVQPIYLSYLREEL